VASNSQTLSRCSNQNSLIAGIPSTTEWQPGIRKEVSNNKNEKETQMNPTIERNKD